MKRFSRSMLGVTLLEIMLVLAIAAMVIVMSVRYYQSASASQQANSIMEMIQAITAAADGISQGTGSYSGVSTGAVSPMMPNGLMTAPWGGAITVAGAATNYTVTISAMPGNVCSQVQPKLLTNTKFKVTSSCAAVGSSADFTYTYSIS